MHGKFLLFWGYGRGRGGMNDWKSTHDSVAAAEAAWRQQFDGSESEPDWGHVFDVDTGLITTLWWD